MIKKGKLQKDISDNERDIRINRIDIYALSNKIDLILEYFELKIINHPPKNRIWEIQKIKKTQQEKQGK